MSEFFSHYTNQYKTPFEGTTPRWLVVCNGGMVRSATIARVIQDKLGHNTRACGTEQYALIPLTLNLIHWADHVVFVDQETYQQAKLALRNHSMVLDKPFEVWKVPDRYQYMETALVDLVVSLL